MKNSFINGNVKIYLAVVLLIVAIIPSQVGFVSADGTCSCSGGAVDIGGDNCGQCYAPQCTTPDTCSCSAALGTGLSCSLSCSSYTDQCPSATIRNQFTDYDQSASLFGTCMSGTCNTFSDCSPVTGICDAAAECTTPQACGTGYLKCVFVQGKLATPQYAWVSSATNNEDSSGFSTLDCSDGHDNDCDGLVDCSDPGCSTFCSQPNAIPDPSDPKLKFRQGTTASYTAVIGSNGVIDLKGVLTVGQSSITSTTNDFLIKDLAGVIVAKIDYAGNLVLKGTNSTKTQVELNTYLSDANKQFIVKNSLGNVVAVFDSSGNFYSLSGIRASIPAPQ